MEDDRCPTHGTSSNRSMTIRLFDEVMVETVISDIVEGITDCKDSDMTTIEPLYTTIDPELLEQFVESSTDGSATIDFVHSGCRISVSGCGTVVVCDEHADQILQQR